MRTSERVSHTWNGGNVCIACGLQRRYLKSGFIAYFIYEKWMIVSPLFECSRIMGEIAP